MSRLSRTLIPAGLVMGALAIGAIGGVSATTSQTTTTTPASPKVLVAASMLAPTTPVRFMPMDGCYMSPPDCKDTLERIVLARTSLQLTRTSRLVAHGTADLRAKGELHRAEVRGNCRIDLAKGSASTPLGGFPFAKDDASLDSFDLTFGYDLVNGATRNLTDAAQVAPLAAMPSATAGTYTAHLSCAAVGPVGSTDGITGRGRLVFEAFPR